MDVVIVVAVLALLLAVLVLLWRMRRGRLARGMGHAGRFYNDAMGLGGGPTGTVVDGGSQSSGPPRARR